MLITCKECKERISDQADPCPRCGVPKPDVPYELERLIQEKEKIQAEERKQVDLYRKYYGRVEKSFPMGLLRRKHNDAMLNLVRQHTELANIAQAKVREKEDEISDFQDKLYRERRQSN